MFEKEIREMEEENKQQSYSSFQADVKMVADELYAVIKKHKKVSGEATTLALLQVTGGRCTDALRHMHGPEGVLLTATMGIRVMTALKQIELSDLNSIFILPLVAGSLLNKVSKEALPGGNLVKPDLGLTL